MTLIDVGPLVALLDTSDPYHNVCVQTAQGLRILQMRTTWPCFAEAMYLLGSAGDYRYQERLWRIRRDGRLDILKMTTTETD